jgi:cytochrome c-type protein NapC
LDHSRTTWIALLAGSRGQGASALSVHPIMSMGAIVCAVLAGVLLVWFLWTKPVLNGHVKLLLLFGFGVFPIGSAVSGNIAGFEHTKSRPFCGSCHVMTPYRLDAENPASRSLAAIHARNEAFGPTNCYECHEEYGAFSTVLTKLGGMRHVYEYYTHYYDMDVKTALAEIELYKPMANASCMRCHSTKVPDWQNVADHRSSLDALRSGRVSCASEGCHGPVHPFAKPKRAHAERTP